MHALVRERHRSREFIEFLKLLDAAYPASTAALNGIQKLATAKSFGEIIHLQSDYLHNRVDVTVARARAIGGYLSELVHDAANLANRTSSKGARLDTQAI
jgi:hypothetical protein